MEKLICENCNEFFDESDGVFFCDDEVEVFYCDDCYWLEQYWGCL